MRGVVHVHASCLLAAVGWVAACNRIEEPQRSADPRAVVSEPPRPPAPPSATAGSPATPPPTSVASAPSARPCPVTTPDEPPPAAAPAATCPKEPGPRPNMPLGWVRFVDAPGAPRIQVELAETPANHAHGLMYRTAMAEDHGMLFSWPTETRRTFWMQNTCIPLDMLFIAADRTIQGILEQVPVLNEAPRSIPCPAAYVLEVNAGYTRRHGVKAGMRVEIE